MSDVRQEPHPPDVVILKSTEYARFKSVLNHARHPTFVGRDTFFRAAREGGAFVFVVDGRDAAVALVKTRHSVLMALSVTRDHQGLGLGSFAIEFLRPNWVRATGEAVPFFEARGYRSVGEPKLGRRLTTQVMVRAEICTLAGRLCKIFGDAPQP